MGQATAVRRALPLAVTLVIIAACWDGTSAQQSAETRPVGAADVPTAPPESSRADALPDFSRLVERYGDAVVNVEVVQEPSQQASGPQLSPEDPLFDFFRRFGIPPPNMGPRGEAPPARGAGSGFIVTSDGYILTNAHVVAEADRVTVRLADRREFQAKVIGADARTDVAVIKIDAQNLPAVRIGDPSRLKPGQWVLAIGSPFGLENTATAGIISATQRAVGGESYVPFIQTDVAVNPGNSGGPLFNMQGEVIGINSMIFSRTGGYMGLSFAIPIDVAANVRDQLIKNGRVVRGRIGVAVQDVNAQLAQSFGLDRPRGALVSSVDPDGPAAKAGVKPGDVILAVGEEEIDRFGELSSRIAAMRPDSKTKLTVWRDGKERTLEVRIGELEEQNARVSRSARGQAGEDAGELGLTIRPLTREEQRQVETEGRVVVEGVSGAAATAGVRPGDIILGVNGKPVDSVKDLRDAVKNGKSTVALLVQRGGAQVFIPVRTK